MGMQVSDVRAEAADLRSRGVMFEEYDQPRLKTVDGLVEMGSLLGGWFKDSEGNLIGLFQRRNDRLVTCRPLNSAAIIKGPTG
jgi:hypothetical protein